MARVGLIGNNSVGYVEKLIGIWNNGDCAVLLDFRIPIKTLTDMMRDADVSMCIIGNSLYQAEIEHLPCDIQFVPFDDSCKSGIVLPSEIMGQFKDNYSYDEAVVIYSSSTTGKSKGIILSHFAINTNADAIIDYMHPTGNDCIYIAKTLSHSSTLTGELLVGLKSHARLLLGPTIVPPRVILSNIMKNKVTILGLNPTLLSMLTDEVERSGRQPETFLTIYVSGSILNDTVYEKAHRILTGSKIYNVYGLSEAGPRVTAQAEDCCKGNSVGKAIKGVEFAVVDENGEIQPASAKGMVHVKTPSLFSGYISGGQKLTSSYKGWLNTGDIGYIDKNGELHIVGRVDDIIIVGARKVYPSEIESDILTVDGILECLVSKVILESGTDAIACYYVANSKRDFSKEIRNLLLSKRATHEIPLKYHRVNYIEKNINGKTIRKNLQNIN